MDKTNLLEHSLVGNKPVKNVAVSNGNGVVINPSTSEKQDTLAGKIDTLLIELQQKTEPSNIQMGELIPMLRSILTAIANPSYVDKSLNSIRIGNNTVTFAANQDIRTLTNLTNFGTFPADHLQRMENMVAWSTNIRNLIT